QNPDIDVARKERTPKNDAEFAPIKSVTALPFRAETLNHLMNPGLTAWADRMSLSGSKSKTGDLE
ncbi:MAG: hypothetical protein K8T89_19805, partial [Planctomycetes bacterium]|nr:hypothetical protein [Planctomycetota bacterium]